MLTWMSLSALLACLLWAPAAQASAPPSPWDGTNPFNCTLQDAGRGTTVPDPAADPYCVHFDKTNQNVTELGLVGFLSLCLLYTSPSPRDRQKSRMPSSA